MRITYLHQYFNTPNMPGGTRSYEMARRLVGKGHEVNMVTSWRASDGRRNWFKTMEEGIRVHWLPVPYSNHMVYRERIRAFLAFAIGAGRKAAQLPADVILASSTPLTIALPGAYAARRQKAPMVFEVRDLWPELPIAMGALRNPLARAAALRLEQFAYNHAAFVIALSPGMRDGVVKTGYPKENVTVIPNSADVEWFESASSKLFRSAHPELGTGPLVVYTGAIGSLNAVTYLPRIAAASKEQGLNTQYAVIGHGKEEEIVRKEANRLGVLGDNFHLYPPVPKKEIPAVLAAADIALSLVTNLEVAWANSANKFFDALGSGTPIAINYLGWQAELLHETGAGFVIPPADPRKAARQLGEFLSSPARVAAAGAAARKLAVERFSRERLASKLEEVLIRAVNSPFKSPNSSSQEK